MHFECSLAHLYNYKLGLFNLKSVQNRYLGCLSFDRELDTLLSDIPFNIIYLFCYYYYFFLFFDVNKYYLI